MMSDEVKAGDPVDKHASAKPGKEDVKPKKGGKLEKYKWWIVGGLAFVVLLAFYFMRNSSSGSANAAQAGGDNIDPATGYPTGSAADLAALGSSGSLQQLPTTGNSGGSVGDPGTAGAAGPAGPAGAKGAPGKTPDLWSIATMILKGRGVKNPTHHAIYEVWKTLGQIGTKPVSTKPSHGPTPTRNPHPSPYKPAKLPKKK